MCSHLGCGHIWPKKYGATVDAIRKKAMKPLATGHMITASNIMVAMSEEIAIDKVASDQHLRCPHGILFKMMPCGLCATSKEGSDEVTMQQPSAPVDGEVKCLACRKALNRTDKNCYACGSTKLSEFDDAMPSSEVSDENFHTLSVSGAWKKQADALRQNTLREFEEYLKRTAAPVPITPPNDQSAGASLGPLGPSVNRTYWVDPIRKVEDRVSSPLAIGPLVMAMIHAEAKRLDALVMSHRILLYQRQNCERCRDYHRLQFDLITNIEAILVEEGF